MTDTKPHNHIQRIRTLIMAALAMYAKTHEGEELDDAAVLGALGAVFCHALIVRGNTIDDQTIDVLRRTYELVEIEHAMQEKEEASETH